MWVVLVAFNKVWKTGMKITEARFMDLPVPREKNQGHTSRKMITEKGVPQRSFLSLKLFLNFISDITENMHSPEESIRSSMLTTWHCGTLRSGLPLQLKDCSKPSHLWTTGPTHTVFSLICQVPKLQLSLNGYALLC